MNIVKLPSPNFFAPGDMPGNKIWAVVPHGTAGPLQAALDWLRNPQYTHPGNAVSSCYVISKAGVIYELVDWQAGKRAYANGPIHPDYDRTVHWLEYCAKAKENPNWHTVSIEHEATSQEMATRARMPDAQFNASIDLTAFIMRKAGLKASHETYVEHHQIAAAWKPTCPGVIFAPAFVEVLIDRNPDLKP